MAKEGCAAVSHYLQTPLSGGGRQQLRKRLAREMATEVWILLLRGHTQSSGERESSCAEHQKGLSLPLSHMSSHQRPVQEGH